MPHWSDQMAPTYIANVANRYIVDKPLTAFEIFPMVNTKRLTGYIGTYTKADWLRIGEVDLYKRTGATESFGDDYAVSKTTYNVEQYSFHKDITRDDMNEFDNPFDPVNDSVDFVMSRMGRVLLKQLIDTFFTTSVWATDTSLASYLWTDKTDNRSDHDPVDHIMDAHEAITKVTGYKANKLILSWDAYKALKTNTLIMDRMKTVTDKVVTADMLAKLFEVDKLIILDSVNETGTDFLTTSRGLLCYTPSRPSKFSPSAGYHINYTGGDIGRPIRTRKILMPELNDSVRIEADMYLDQLVLATDLGVYLYGMC